MSSQASELDLRGLFGLLRRRIVMIVVIVAVCTAAGIVISRMQDPVYEARARALLDVSISERVLTQGSNSRAPTVDEQVTTELDQMRSAQAMDAIAEHVGYTPQVRISVDDSEEETTRTITVVGRGSTAEEAATNANDFTEGYVTIREVEIHEQLADAIEDQEALLTALDLNRYEKEQRLEAIDLELPSAEGDTRGRLEAERRRLEGELGDGSMSAASAEINSRITALQQAQFDNDGGMFKVSRAQVPSSPVSPQPARDAAIAFMVGLVLGVTAALLRDYFDDSIRTKEDLEAVTTDLPTLGIIPAIRGWKDAEAARVESLEKPSSPPSEAYRSMRIALEFIGVDRPLAVVQVTSSTPGEGKSTTAANLAVSLARAGKHVVLVDCDLRRPRAHEFFGLDNTVGLTTVILGTSPLDQALQRVPDLPGLFVLTSGPKPPNPAELLSNDVTRSKLEVLARSADYVIIDSPPLLPVADPIVLARYADATLLVIKARHANRRSVKRSIEILEQVEAPLAGVVLNGVGHEATYGYGYGYGYAVDDDPAFRSLVLSKVRAEDSNGRGATSDAAGARGSNGSANSSPDPANSSTTDTPKTARRP